MKASADAYVSTAHAAENFGQAKLLRLDNTPRITSFLRFDLGAPLKRVENAVLRLRTTSVDGDAVQVRAITAGGWQETAVTSANAPRYGAPVDAPADLRGGWVSMDVTALVRGRAVVDLVLTAASNRSVQMQSREAAAPPQLVLREAAGTPAPQVDPDLRQIVEDVRGATAKRYGVHDDAGGSMDSLKVVAAPGGGYLGVYHAVQAGVLVSRVATSHDLLHWRRRAVIDKHASQPAISVLGDRSVLVAEEADSNGSIHPRTWLRLRHYPDLAALLVAQPDRSFDVPHTQVPATGAEGTPDIRSVQLAPDLSRSTIEIGFHFFRDGKVDRQARGVLSGFSTWVAWPDVTLGADIERLGMTGSIGDRDTIVLSSQRLALVEARRTPDGPWSTLLYDEARRQVTPLRIRTDLGSSSFANPTVTVLRAPSGARAVVVTLFLPATGAVKGETGELVYYKEIGPRSRGGDPVLAAAGDVACPTLKSPPEVGDCGQSATADLVEGLAPSAVLALGDLQYERGSLQQFLDSYDGSWGRFRDITYPVPGNHEYKTAGAAGYYNYFGLAADRTSRGWYSFDLGGWHLVALNSECAAVGGCSKGSPQERWLAADLAAHSASCVLAYWHEPRFSSGQHGNNPLFAAFWDDLYAAGADVVLNGHDHDYERFGPQDPAAQADPARGIRQFVVGTGGKQEREFDRPPAANSELRRTGVYGVLRLELHPQSFDWRFVGTPGSTLSDSGSATCHPGAGLAKR